MQFLQSVTTSAVMLAFCAAHHLKVQTTSPTQAEKELGTVTVSAERS